MAIKISGTNVIDNNRKFIPVTIEAGGTVGTAGSVLASTGSGVQWKSGANIQEFASSGTWTKPGGATFVMVELWGAGGGGGSGSRKAIGGGDPVHSIGGGGGGGGSYVYRLFKASDLTSTVSVTIGSRGTGAAAKVTNNTNGSSGNPGGNSTFGSYLTSYGGEGGLGSALIPFTTSAFSAPGGGGGGMLSRGSGSTGGGIYNTALLSTSVSTNVSDFGGADGNKTVVGRNSGFGGGSGGTSSQGNTAAGTVSRGGISVYGGNGGTGGGMITGTGNLTNPTTSADVNLFGFGIANGGNSSISSNAGSGSNASSVACGGGGGGASINGYNSGAGGNGGNGQCRVYSW